MRRLKIYVKKSTIQDFKLITVHTVDKHKNSSVKSLNHGYAHIFWTFYEILVNR